MADQNFFENMKPHNSVCLTIHGKFWCQKITCKKNTKLIYHKIIYKYFLCYDQILSKY